MKYKNHQTKKSQVRVISIFLALVLFSISVFALNESLNDSLTNQTIYDTNNTESLNLTNSSEIINSSNLTNIENSSENPLINESEIIPNTEDNSSIKTESLLNPEFLFIPQNFNNQTNITYWLHNETVALGYLQMKNVSTDLARVNTSLVAGSNTIFCWPTNWTLSENFTTPTSIDGIWQFHLNYSYTYTGGTPNMSFFTQIFKLNSSGVRIDVANTSQFDAGGSWVSAAMRSINWNYTLSSNAYTNLNIGDKFGVQLCINVLSQGGGAKTAVLFYENSTRSRVIVPISTITSYPTITVYSPLNTTYSSNNITVNFTSLDNNGIDSRWFYNGTGNTTYTQVIYQTVSQGSNTFLFYSNNSANRVNSTNITFYVDSIPPVLNFTSITESSGSTYRRNNILVNVTASDSGVDLKNITLYLYNATSLVNLTINNSANSLYINFTNLPDSIYYFNASASDGFGNTNSTETRNITIDNLGPTITVISPIENYFYNSENITINFSAVDTYLSVGSYWFFNESNNATYTSPNLIIVPPGNHSFIFYANDSLGNVGNKNINFTINGAPNITELNGSPNPILGGNTIVITPNLTDINNDTLYFYCSESSSLPDNFNTLCTGGNTVGNSPYNLTCSYVVAVDSALHRVYCRAYDGKAYSNNLSTTFTTVSGIPISSVVSVARTFVQSYYDNLSDSHTDIIVSGNKDISCKWSSSDLSYDSMSNTCSAVTGLSTYSNCSIDDAGVVSEGLKTRYISCSDLFGNSQNSTQNLDVSFYVDYTGPSTYDNSNSNVQLSPYSVTIIENDSVDTNSITYYCQSTSQGCNPTTVIDNAGQITFTTRGTNYLRYYSVDFANNVQTIVNKTININRLPIFNSATGTSGTFKGGSQVNISTNSYDPDSQNLTLYVCKSSSVNSSGCLEATYCNSTGSGNLTCSFYSENDSSVHIWYAYIYDSLQESASSSKAGFYTTDSLGPSITISSPTNTTYTSSVITLDVILDSTGGSVWYSLDNSANVSITNISSLQFLSLLSVSSLGSHNIIVYANDSYGNIASSTVYFTRITAPDTTKPVITILSPVNASYYSSGTVNLNITSDKNLSSSFYSLNNGALSLLGNVSLTNWNITLSINGESTQNLTIYANDTASPNNQANKSIIFYVDTLAPRYSSISATPSSANQSQAVNCSITWTDGFNITSVIIGENSSGTFENHTIPFSGISGSASYVIIGSKLTNIGTYTCQFFATDAAGNINSTSTTFTVSDVTPPSLIVTSPSNATYNQQNISISFIASKNITWAWYSLNGTSNVSMSNTSSINWNATLLNLVNLRSYNLIFYANDSLGNVGNSSLIYFAINTGAPDTIAPVLTMNTLSNGTYYTQTTLGLNITSNENLTSARYKLNSGSLNSMSNSSTTNWNATLSGLGTESTNDLEVYGNDSSNNLGNTNITFYVDTLIPRITLVNASPSIANETQSIICNAYVNDSFELSSVKIAENSSGTFVNHTIDLSSAGYANYTLANVQKGGYTCTFYARDLAGNVNNSESVNFVVNDVSNPIITINSPLATSYSTNSILLSVTLNENASLVEYSLDGSNNISMTGSSVSWSDLANIADGSHAVIFYATDNSGNIGGANVSFSIDTTIYDTTKPVITIWGPTNNSYFDLGTILLNITSDKALSWAGYKLNSGSLTNLYNVSNTNWNTTESLAEGLYNLTFYGNDTTTNKNQGNKSSIFYVDLNNPSISNFICTNPVNDSRDVNCSATISDTIGLAYAIFSDNSSGTWSNYSQVSLSGLSSSISNIIGSTNTSIGVFGAKLYLYDKSGRENSSSYTITVLDDIPPAIYNISYSPNDSDSLDPGVLISVNTTISENYNLSSVVLMYKESGDVFWTSVVMTNNSELNTSGPMNVVYNSTFTPGNGTYSLKINATDSQGNQNISSIYLIPVANDTSLWNYTSISDIKSILISQETENNSLGFLYLNNTGENPLNLVIILGSDSLGNRLNINWTGNQTMNYSLSPKQNLSLEIIANTSGLPASLLDYNLTVSSEANEISYSKKLNIQTSAGPYLVTTIDTYSSSVTRGQSGISFRATVKNLGTQEATGVSLNWTLPSEFTLVSGNLTRSLSSFPIGVSGTNTLTVSVSSSASSSSVNITAIASASNANSSSDSKIITIIDPVVVTNTVTTGGGGGAAGGSGGGQSISYNKEIEVTRGSTIAFNIDVKNSYPNKTLENLTLIIQGFPEQYTSVTPDIIKNLKYGEKSKFVVQLKLPTYNSYEEKNLAALISGRISSGFSTAEYTETQNIKLLIQEISHEQATKELELAKQAISEMKSRNMSATRVDSLYLQASELLNNKNLHKASFDISQNIVSVKETAFETEDLLRRIITAMQDPKKSNLIVGNIVRNLGDYNQQISLIDLVNEKAVFASISIEDLVSLGIAAFERGDYESALTRAKEARNLLILERKGNFLLFLYLYWPILLLGIFVLSVFGTLGYRNFQKTRISKKIEDLNKKEDSTRKVLIDNQAKYFLGKESPTEYRRNTAQAQKEIVKIKKERETLSNTRIKLLEPQEVSKDLEKERKEVEKQIVTIQEKYYKDKEIPETEYKEEFSGLNERLAEIEDEKTTLDILEKNKTKSQKTNSEGFLDKIKNFFENRRARKDKDIKLKIDKMLKDKKGESIFI